MEYRVSPASAEDETFLKELFFDVRASEFLPLQLPPPALTQLLEMQHRAQKAGYGQQYPHAEESVIWVGPYRVGRMLVDSSSTAIHLVDIALLTPFRGHGIGRSLLDSLCQRASQAGVPLSLTVRSTNPAIRLYRRAGFTPCGKPGVDVEMQWGGAAPAAADVREETSETGPIVPGLNGAYFRSIRGSKAVVYRAGLENVVLTLVSVRALRADPDPTVVPGDSFELTFEGSSDAMLQQQIYGLEFEDEQRMEIFLVPIAAANGIAVYESVFNRMSRPTAKK
jgi:ribosomal protein S18 acetylase RimI-like enzyme